MPPGGSTVPPRHQTYGYASSMTQGDESTLEVPPNASSAGASDPTAQSESIRSAHPGASNRQGVGTDATVHEAPTAVGPLGIRPLTPTYDKKAHADTVRTLLDLVAPQPSRSSLIRNVAIAGPYGSGKSSVLLQFQEELDDRAINISLSSLSSIDPELDVAADRDGRPLPTTNFIQKEVIKQLLYRGQPDEFPESRYSRIYRRSNGPDIAVGGAVAAAWVVIAGLTGLPEAMARTFADGNLRAGWGWILVIAFILSAAGYSIFGALKRRFSIQSVSAGPAAITLQGRNTYYFDEYLDEIIYYFEESTTDVVIFEDIDRFDDTHIFESLRNLNVVLNNSAQVGRPIYFVYAVRDSIFGSSQASRGGRIAVDTVGSRTKFFDAIVPLVPFITYKTAQDLLKNELIGVDNKPGASVIAAVGEHVSDMRLLRNIVNEYRVFARSLLRGGTLLDLTPDNLFVMVTYKNLEPRNFDLIRSGDSDLDYLQDQLDALASARIQKIDVETTDLHSDRNGADLGSPQLRRRVETLLARIDIATTAISGVSYLNSFQVGSEVFSSDKQQRGSLTRALLEADEATFGSMTLSKSQLETLAGGSLTMNDAVEESNRLLNERLRQRRTERAALSNGNFATYIKSSISFDTKAGRKTAKEIAAMVLGAHSDLWIKMIIAGHLDQNFTIYTAKYYGTTLSPDGLSYVIRNIQRNKPDFQRKFARSADIQTILDERGESFFREDAALNLDIIDFLVTHSHDGLKILAERLVEFDDVAKRFLSTYVRSEAATVLWSAVAKEWPYAVTFLAEEDGLQTDRASELLSTTLQNPIPYEASDAGCDLVQTLSDSLSVLETEDTNIAANVSRHYKRFNVHVRSLSVASSVMQHSLVDAGMYAVTRENVLIATGLPHLPSLNQLRRDHREVFRSILPYVAYYLAEREGDDGPGLIDDELTIDIVNEVAEIVPAASKTLAESATADLLIENLLDVAAPARLPLFALGHVTLTTTNLKSVIGDAETIPKDALPLLEREQAFVDASPIADPSVALLIANDDRLTVQTRVHLVDSSGAELAAQSIEASDILGGLVEIGALEDDAVTARQAAALGPSTLADFVSTSDNWASIAPRIGVPLTADSVASILASAEVRDTDITATVEQLPSWKISDPTVLKAASARCVAAKDVTLSVSALAWIAKSAPSIDVVTLLARNISSLDSSDIHGVTDRMNSEFQKLSSARGRATLPNHQAVIKVLEHLKVPQGFVTSWKPFDGGLHVWFRH